MAGTGGGGSGGTAGAVAAAGAAGALLELPASSSCASGNVKGAFSVCRGCHIDGGAGPFPLVTLADIVPYEDEIVVAIGGRGQPATMPKSGSLSNTNKALILAWIAAGAHGVPVASCP
jgi:hypothetical protein